MEISRARLLLTSRLLSLRLWFLPIWVLRFLLDIRSLLVHQMGFLAVARVRSATVLEIRRPSLLHPKGTICYRRDYKGAVRPDDARPSTAQPRIPKRIGDAKHFASSFLCFSSGDATCGRLLQKF